ATEDRPDDVRGPQIHVVYAVPRGGHDRRLDRNGVLADSVASWNRWLRSQTGGSELRLDTARGLLDVTYFQSPLTADEMEEQHGWVVTTLERELSDSGVTTPGKLYAIYWDGPSKAGCGQGSWPPSFPGRTAALYLRGLDGTKSACEKESLSSWAPGYWEFGMLHEVLHALGFVPACARHDTGTGHVSDDRRDLMYTGSEPWHPGRLDVGHDDYFRARIHDCPDLAASPYLVRSKRG
ncbi:MAG: hypothetical protein M3540_05240, partial [Actinomycetota bacterium]|nr:hypothetical protein [Actinomycetota bacterium]